jgi:Tfp pilus assembly protein PilF
LSDPNDMQIRAQMAIALYKLGETVKAKEQCQIAVHRDPENGESICQIISGKE